VTREEAIAVAQHLGLIREGLRCVEVELDDLFNDRVDRYVAEARESVVLLIDELNELILDGGIEPDLDEAEART
jgi:hypothetical protein